MESKPVDMKIHNSDLLELVKGCKTVSIYNNQTGFVSAQKEDLMPLLGPSNSRVYNTILIARDGELFVYIKG